MEKQDGIGNLVQRQVWPIIIVENTIHSIINLNLIIINKFNSIIMIEQDNKLFTSLIMIGKKWKMWYYS